MAINKIKATTLKSGKKPAKHDKRTLQFSNYTATLSSIPAKCNWGAKVKKWGMLQNDRIENCTCVTAAYLIMEWTANNGKECIPTDEDVIKVYSALTGYNPKTGANNKAVVAIDLLNYWRKKGIAKHKITVYAALETKNHDHIKEAVYLFGGCYIGLQLPASALPQKVWDVIPAGATGQGKPGSWTGHAVAVVAYDSKGLTVVTWGMLKKMTWDFWDTYCDEAYAIISPDFLKDGKTVHGFDMDILLKDLKAIEK